jgi:hypothetical protein
MDCRKLSKVLRFDRGGKKCTGEVSIGAENAVDKNIKN